MALWNVGGLLESSGWETALNEAAVASVVMLGGLHIEMALWNVGGLLESSGWETALNEAAVASARTVDSFLEVSHLIRIP